MTYKQEKITPYNNTQEKGEQVEQMFDNIAHSYDKLNHRLSWNIDKAWRKMALNRLKPFKPQHILDVATGTGDFAIQAATMLNPKQVVGADISEGSKEDCMNLSFPEASFDAVIAAFGIRNFQNLDKGLEEMHRVLKKGGHLCILELTTPVHFPMRQLFKIYSHTILPLYGRMISGDKTAYSYLTATIEAFPQGEVMVGILKKAGFAEASFKRFTLGICTMYFATK